MYKEIWLLRERPGSLVATIKYSNLESHILVLDSCLTCDNMQNISLSSSKPQFPHLENTSNNYPFLIS